MIQPASPSRSAIFSKGLHVLCAVSLCAICVDTFAAPVDFLGLLSIEPPCADPADDFAQLIRIGREEGWLDALMPKWTQNATWWTNFVAQARALDDTPFYIDFHVGQLSRLSNAQDALKGKHDPDILFSNHGARPHRRERRNGHIRRDGTAKGKKRRVACRMGGNRDTACDAGTSRLAQRKRGSTC